MRSNMFASAGLVAALSSAVVARPASTTAAVFQDANPINGSVGPLAARQEAQGPGTPLYLNAPACDFYQCTINITWGDHITTNWLNAPEGNVSIDLVRNPNGEQAYHIATVPGTSQPGYCDAGFGVGTVVQGTTCGAYDFVLPHNYAAGNYSFCVTSTSNPNLQSYTDVVLIQDHLNRTDPSASFAALPISGAPTSTTSSGTNFASAPSPTAPTSPGASTPAGAPTHSAESKSGSETAAASGSGTASSHGPESGTAHSSPPASQASKSAARSFKFMVDLRVTLGMGALVGMLLLA